MNRYYEGGLPASNYHGPLPDVAFGENNHIAQVLIDHSNEYGTRVVIGCWSSMMMLTPGYIGTPSETTKEPFLWRHSPDHHPTLN